jgi:hypothetical protein
MTHRIKYPRARLSPAKQELLVIEFPRERIEADDTAQALEVLSAFTESRETAEWFEGRLTFFFSGWDDDPRETAEIPEIRAWFADLTGAFPYWFHFVEKEGDTFFHVLRLLCAGHIERIEQGMIGWRFDDRKQLSAVVETLFGYMNGLYQKLGLPEEMGRRVTEEVGQLVEGALG